MTIHRQQGWALGSALCATILLTAAPIHAQTQRARDAGAGADDARIVVYPEGKDTAEDPPRADQAEALQRRAGEEIDGDPQGRAVVLGMHLQEADHDRVEVVEVGAATPAFDAGIRKGDLLVSFDGFKGDSYRKWLDGIRKLMNEAPEGDTMPIQLQRDGKVINLRFRKPVAHADDPRAVTRSGPVTRYQELPQPSQLGPQLPAPTQGPPAASGSNNIAVAPFFGGQFGERMGGTTDRAVAELFRVDGSQQTTQTGAAAPTGQPNNTLQSGAAPGASQGGGRIGIAGFRNEQNGMLVMVDVGGLAPGNYLVGIDEGGLLGTQGGFETGATGTNATTPSREQRQSQFQRRPKGVAPRNNDSPTSRGGSAQPQGSNLWRDRLVPATVLAQVLDGSQDPSATQTTTTQDAGPFPLDTPATGRTGTLDTPDTGRRQPLDTPATGDPAETSATQNTRPRTNSQDTELDSTGRGAIGDARTDGLRTGGNPGPGAAGGPAITVGTLSVDQSGVGRLQQVVEGVQVQQVVGQFIVIYSQNGSPGVAQRPDVRGTRPGGAARSPDAGVPPTAGTAGSGIKTQPGENMQPMPIAAGSIRMVSDRRPNGATPAIGQPEASLPEAGQELR